MSIVYNISNLKIIFNEKNEQLIFLEDNDTDALTTPVFSADGITEQEEYLITMLLKERQANAKVIANLQNELQTNMDKINSLESTDELLNEIIRDLRTELKDAKTSFEEVLFENKEVLFENKELQKKIVKTEV